MNKNLFSINHIQIGTGERKSKQFLDNVVNKFINLTKEYHKITGDLPFAYRERQLHSILLPAVSKVSDAAFVEQPIKRKGKRKDGWLDYWIKYHNCVFFMELKHGWMSYRTMNINESSKNKWSQAWEQLEIKKSDVNSLSMGLNPIKISLIVIPYYMGSNDEDNLDPIKLTEDEIKEMLENQFDRFNNPSPNWTSLWRLNKNLQGPYEYSNRFELHPCVAFVARVESF